MFCGSSSTTTSCKAKQQTTTPTGISVVTFAAKHRRKKIPGTDHLPPLAVRSLRFDLSRFQPQRLPCSSKKKSIGSPSTRCHGYINTTTYAPRQQPHRRRRFSRHVFFSHVRPIGCRCMRFAVQGRYIPDQHDPLHGIQITLQG